MSAMDSHHRVLDALEASVKTILLHTGSAFSDAGNYDSSRLVRTSTQLKAALPPALSQFHDALDQLESELMQARAVLYQDLVNAKTKKVGGAELKPATNSGITNNAGPADVEMVDNIRIQNNETESPTMEVDTEETAISSEPMGTTPSNVGINEVKPELRGEEMNHPIPPAPLTAATGLDSKLVSQASQAPTQPATEETQAQAPPATAVSAGITTKSGEQDLTSPNDLFGDSIFGTPGSNPDINMDSGTATGTANLTPLNNPDVDNLDDPQNALSTVDVNSLLPGLEFYANDTSDMNNGLNNLEQDQANLDSFAASLTNGTHPDLLSANINRDGEGSMDGAAGQFMGDTGHNSGDASINFDDFFATFGTGGDTVDAGSIGFGAQAPVEGEDTAFDESFFSLDP